jgi:hypothetical protein
MRGNTAKYVFEISENTLQLFVILFDRTTLLQLLLALLAAAAIKGSGRRSTRKKTLHHLNLSAGTEEEGEGVV